MARTISEIKAEIGAAYISHETVRSAYGLDENASFDKVFSPISVESVLFYVVASCIWVLEQLFDRHKAEVEHRIEALRPHTLRWYVSKTLAYMHNYKLVQTNGVVAADYYDTTGMSESEIEAKKMHAGLFFEASCVGGVPIIRTLQEGMQANKILSIKGIINGTTNYILTKMAYEGSSYEEALKEAQRLGYAEFDPTADVEGFVQGCER